MLRMIDRSRMFSLERIWFPEDGCGLDSESDIVRLLRVRSDHAEYKGSINEINYTLISNLDESEGELFSKMRRSYRAQIRRCADDGDVAVSMYEAANLKEAPSIIRDFCDTYMTFCASSKMPGLKKFFDARKINSYIENNCITVSRAAFKNGSVYHLYVHDDKNTVILYSASDFRNKDVDSNLAGRANKFLHYKDMMYFKAHGLRSYDWGNISSPIEPNGVDNFKIAFGGEKTAVYNIFLGNSLSGKILVSIRKYIAYKRRGK